MPPITTVSDSRIDGIDNSCRSRRYALVRRAAIVDRLTRDGTIIETAIDAFRLAHTTGPRSATAKLAAGASTATPAHPRSQPSSRSAARGGTPVGRPGKPCAWNAAGPGGGTPIGREVTKVTKKSPANPRMGPPPRRSCQTPLGSRSGGPNGPRRAMPKILIAIDPHHHHPRRHRRANPSVDAGSAVGLKIFVSD